MHQKPDCPHRSDAMCSCKALDSSRSEEMKLHFLRNLSDMRLELSYNALTAPAPYCLCVAGTCKTCRERLCMSIGMPAHLAGDGLLAVVLHHALHLELKCPDSFVELFHEEDRPAARLWLESLEKPGSKRALPSHEVPVVAYTIVQAGADVDHGFFPDPFTWGCYLSLDLAREKRAELIAQEKKTLSGRYDKEERTDDCWEAYEDGYAAACFVRIEILSSEIVLNRKGGPDGA